MRLVMVVTIIIALMMIMIISDLMGSGMPASS
jgi:hypothetical protein